MGTLVLQDGLLIDDEVGPGILSALWNYEQIRKAPVRLHTEGLDECLDPRALHTLAAAKVEVGAVLRGSTMLAVEAADPATMRRYTETGLRRLEERRAVLPLGRVLAVVYSYLECSPLATLVTDQGQGRSLLRPVLLASHTVCPVAIEVDLNAGTLRVLGSPNSRLEREGVASLGPTARELLGSARAALGLLVTLFESGLVEFGAVNSWTTLARIRAG